MRSNDVLIWFDSETVYYEYGQPADIYETAYPGRILFFCAGSKHKCPIFFVILTWGIFQGYACWRVIKTTNNPGIPNLRAFFFINQLKLLANVFLVQNFRNFMIPTCHQVCNIVWFSQWIGTIRHDWRIRKSYMKQVFWLQEEWVLRMAVIICSLKSIIYCPTRKMLN